MTYPKIPRLLPTAALALALATLVVTPPAQAQPDPDNAPKADNPENRNARRQRQREERVERYVRSQIERAGVTDEKQQDATFAYIQAEIDARENLQEESRTLSTALRNKTLADAQVAGLLNTYMVAVEDDRARRKAAQKTLGESLDILTVPRLEAMLTLMGLWGEAPNMGGNAFAMRGRGRG